MTIRFYDDSVFPGVVNLIEKTLFSSQTPWKIPNGGFSTVHDPKLEQRMILNPKIIDASQFSHPIFGNGGRILSNLYPLISDFIATWIDQHLPTENINDEEKKYISLLRVKANLMILQSVIPEKEIFYNPPHFDPHVMNKNGHMIVLLYYVNDSDGDTFFFSDQLGENIEKRVSPKKGRVVVFDGYHCHASSPPQKNRSRCVINANILIPYEVKDFKD